MIRDVSVSPDDQRVAMVVATGTRRTGLVISSPDGQLKTILNEPGDPLIRLTQCAWLTSTRLLCSLFGIVDPQDPVGIRRMLAIKASLWKEASPAQNAGRIKAPVLLFHGDRDLNVSINQSRLMASKLRDAGGKVELIE